MASAKYTNLPVQIPPNRKTAKKFQKGHFKMVGKVKNDCGHRVGNPCLKPYAFISLHCLFAILVFHFFIQRAIGVCGVNGQYAQ
jgi:hypothetical protein